MYIDYYEECSEYLLAIGLPTELLREDVSVLRLRLEQRKDQIERFLANEVETPDSKAKKLKYEEALGRYTGMKQIILREEFCQRHDDYFESLNERFGIKLLASLNLTPYDIYSFLNTSEHSRKGMKEVNTDSTPTAIQIKTIIEHYNRKRDFSKRDFTMKLMAFVRNESNVNEYNWFIKNKMLYHEFSDQLKIERTLSDYINRSANTRDLTINKMRQLCGILSFDYYSLDEALEYANNFVSFRHINVSEGSKVSVFIDLLEQAIFKLSEIDRLDSYRDNPPSLSEYEIEKIKANALDGYKPVQILRTMPMPWKIFGQWDGFRMAGFLFLWLMLISMYVFWEVNRYESLELIIRGSIIVAIFLTVYLKYNAYYRQLGRQYKETIELRWAIPLTLLKFLYLGTAIIASLIVFAIGNSISEIFQYINKLLFSYTLLGKFAIAYWVTNLLEDPFHIIANNKYYKEYNHQKDIAVEAHINKRNSNYFNENKCSDKIEKLTSDAILSELPEQYRNSKTINIFIQLALTYNLSTLSEVLLKYDNSQVK